MARLVFEDNYGVYWATSVAAINAPTGAEIVAAEDITDFIPKDGFNPGASNNTVDVGHLGTAYDATEIGSYGHNLSVTMFKDDEDDDAWDLFPRGARGFLIVSPFSRVPGSGDPVYVWKCAAQEPTLPSTAANTRQSFTVEFAVQDADMRAVVDGSATP